MTQCEQFPGRCAAKIVVSWVKSLKLEPNYTERENRSTAALSSESVTRGISVSS